MAFYRPIASQGFRFSEAYTELVPCAALRPYIHCFWGNTGMPVLSASPSLVIPDTCMDLIFRIYDASAQVQCTFCAIDDAAYYASPRDYGKPYTTFAIRFFAWTAAAFTEDSLQDTKSMVFPAQTLFPNLCREIAPRLPELGTLQERVALAEAVLLRHFRPERISVDLLNALSAIINMRGACRLNDAARSICLSARQLERLMRRELGAPPKLMMQLIRHQMIYRELLEHRFCTADAVEHYGYADQSHLIRDFRRFHLLSPSEVLSGMR